MRSFLGVPIVGRERVFGNLYLTEKLGATEFDAEDEAIAVLLARQAAVAVENARLHDETARLLDQVQALQRQRDLFFAMMNHELRNALTGVYGWAERLVRPGGEPVSRAAREVFEAAERTITLLNNFLDLTRLDAGRVRPVWRGGGASASQPPRADSRQPVVQRSPAHPGGLGGEDCHRTGRLRDQLCGDGPWSRCAARVAPAHLRAVRAVRSAVGTGHGPRVAGVAPARERARRTLDCGERRGGGGPAPPQPCAPAAGRRE